MTERCRVSVIIPAYNVGRFIDEALASVAAQRRPAHEVVVVDDGSTDDTNARIRAWGGRCGPARLTLLDGPNRGLSRSRNRAIEASEGDLLAFLDGDDCFLPWHLERLVPAFEADTSLAVAFGDLMRFQDGGGDLIGNLQPVREALRAISTPLGDSGLLRLGSGLRAIFLRRSRILPSSWIVSRAAIERTGMFDPELAYGEDIDFFWRLTGPGTAIWHDAATARRREHGNNASNVSRAEWSEPQLLRAATKIHRASSALTEAESAAVARFLERALWANGWLAAGRGLRHYLEWRKETSAMVGRPIGLRPKQLIRAIVRSR